MIPTLLAATICFVIAFVAAPPVATGGAATKAMTKQMVCLLYTSDAADE